MNVVIKQANPVPKLHWPSDLKPGTVYSWGGKMTSYLRVMGGSIALSGSYNLISETSHQHFCKLGGAGHFPWVEVATDVMLTVHYEV